jgi:hypothetical protein
VRIERKVGATVAITGSLLLALSAAAPAIAGSHPSGLALATGARFADVAKSKTSTTAGGWEFTPKGAKSVTTEYTIPSLKCTSAASGFGPLAAAVTGTTSSENFDAAGLLMECSGGTPEAEALVVVNGTSKPDTKAVAVGDLIKATITVSSSKTVATVQDLTKGHTSKVTLSGTGAPALEELIIDDSLVNTETGKQLAVADFGTVNFTSGAVSGKAIGTVKPSSAFNMATKKGVLQILVGKITGAKKNSFLTTWKHS